MLKRAAFSLTAAGILFGGFVAAQSPRVAIVGATLIDGNGGPPVADAVVVIDGSRIAAAGPRAAVTVPAGARIVDGAGQFVVPGFVDTNVHLSPYGGSGERYESLVRYAPREAGIVLEAAQIDLAYGVTSVRGSYGMLMPLVETRDRINEGRAVGPRILATGNILGWSGPYSISFSLTRPNGLTLFQEQMNDEIAQGGGEELMGMTPAQLRVAIDQYLPRGPLGRPARRHPQHPQGRSGLQRRASRRSTGAARGARALAAGVEALTKGAGHGVARAAGDL
jgi:hypothetical protein